MALTTLTICALLAAAPRPGGPAPAAGWPAEVAAHITPMVTLVERADALRRLLPDARRFFVREVRLDRAARSHLRERVRWAPEDDEAVAVYVGRTAADAPAGTVVFVRVDTRHGSLRLAVAFGPDGRVLDVLLTDVSEEMIPWAREALAAGWTRAFRDATADGPIPDPTPPEAIGAMARHVGRAITTGVRRAAALYVLLYPAGAPA